MSNKTLLGILMVACFMPWIANAQDITIGDVEAETSTYNVPFNNYYNYSFVEQIYTASEIQAAGGCAGTITSISFYRKVYSNDPRPTTISSNQIVLYMKNVNQASFQDNRDYVQVAESDIVFEGTFSIPTSEGWVTITLSTPFEYDVTKNLLVAMDENSPNYLKRCFSSIPTSSTPKRVHSFYSDTENPNPYNLSPFINGNQNYFNNKNNNLLGCRANIQLRIIPEGGSTCQKPTTLECSNVTFNSATLIWSEGSGLYNVEYKKVSDIFWTSALTNTGNLTATLTNLQEDTDYQARIQSVCGDNIFSNWNVVEFHTKCGSIVTFPWTENFDDLHEGAIPPCWDNNDGTTIMIALDQPTNHYWCFTNGQQGNGNSNGTGHHGTKCVRFDSFYNSLDRTNFLKTQTLDFPENTLMVLNFWYRNPTGGDFSVYISTDGGETYTDTLASSLPNQTEWTEVQIELNDYVGAQNVVIVFGGISNNGHGDAFIYLDDVSIKGTSFTKDIMHYTEGKNDRYYLIASPVEEVHPEKVSGMFDNKFDLYYFDQTQPKEWINYWSTDFSLVPGKGYLYANSEDVTLTFTGMPYNGDGKVTLARFDEYKFPGVNLVGNPFSYTAYIDRDFYVLNAEGTELEAANRNYVEPMEGIFVIAAEDGEVLTFSREAPAKGAKLTLNLSGPSPVVEPVETPALRQAQGPTTIIDRAVIRFDEKGVLPKFQIGHSSKLYITQDNIDYAVVRSEGKGELPVSFIAEKDGTYTLSFNSEGIAFEYLHLIDHNTGDEIDLLALRPHSTGSGTEAQGPAEYSFECQAGDYANRFTILYQITVK